MTFFLQKLPLFFYEMLLLTTKRKSSSQGTFCFFDEKHCAHNTVSQDFLFNLLKGAEDIIICSYGKKFSIVSRDFSISLQATESQDGSKEANG